MSIKQRNHQFYNNACLISSATDLCHRIRQQNPGEKRKSRESILMEKLTQNTARKHFRKEKPQVAIFAWKLRFGVAQIDAASLSNLFRRWRIFSKHMFCSEKKKHLPMVLLS